MTRLAVPGCALCLVGCLRVASVGLGSDQPPGEPEVAPDAANGQGIPTDGSQAALGGDAGTGASTQADSGAADDDDDESEPDDEQDVQSDDDEAD